MAQFVSGSKPWIEPNTQEYSPLFKSHFSCRSVMGSKKYHLLSIPNCGRVGDMWVAHNTPCQVTIISSIPSCGRVGDMWVAHNTSCLISKKSNWAKHSPILPTHTVILPKHTDPTYTYFKPTFWSYPHKLSLPTHTLSLATHTLSLPMHTLSQSTHLHFAYPHTQAYPHVVWA